MGGRQQGCCLSGGQGSGGIEFRKEVGRRVEAGVCKDSCVTDRTCTECAPGLTYFLSEGQLLLCGVQRKQGGGCRETTARASTGHPLPFLNFLLWGQGSCLCLLQVRVRWLPPRTIWIYPTKPEICLCFEHSLWGWNLGCVPGPLLEVSQLLSCMLGVSSHSQP